MSRLATAAAADALAAAQATHQSYLAQVQFVQAFFSGDLDVPSPGASGSMDPHGSAAAATAAEPKAVSAAEPKAPATHPDLFPGQTRGEPFYRGQGYDGDFDEAADSGSGSGSGAGGSDSGSGSGSGADSGSGSGSAAIGSGSGIGADGTSASGSGSGPGV